MIMGLLLKVVIWSVIGVSIGAMALGMSVVLVGIMT